MALKQAYEDMKFLYSMIIKENKIEYTCVYMKVNERKEALPKTYTELYKKLSVM